MEKGTNMKKIEERKRSATFSIGGRELAHFLHWLGGGGRLDRGGGGRTGEESKPGHSWCSVASALASRSNNSSFTATVASVQWCSSASALASRSSDSALLCCALARMGSAICGGVELAGGVACLREAEGGRKLDTTQVLVA
jgi:hypothetical protein